MCTVARYYDISSKADHGDILIDVHNKKIDISRTLKAVFVVIETNSKD